MNMLNINSALYAQAVDLLDEHGIDCHAAEAPGCASLSFYGPTWQETEAKALKLLTDHFGDSIILSVTSSFDA